jgi:hypothetical protein
MAGSRRAQRSRRVALGRKGDLKGGKARAANLTAEERSEIADRSCHRAMGQAFLVRFRGGRRYKQAKLDCLLAMQLCHAVS